MIRLHTLLSTARHKFRAGATQGRKNNVTRVFSHSQAGLVESKINVRLSG